MGDRNIHKLSNRETVRIMEVVSQEETEEFDLSVEDIILMGRYPYKQIFEADS